ncbi:MAG TPA: hypothetical protein VF798_17575 [Burkholderiaceae bacterium]
MSVSSVPSSTGAIGQALQAPKTAHRQNAGPAEAFTQNGGTQQARPQTQTVQAPKPVVNGQGQKTGQILNTTA